MPDEIHRVELRGNLFGQYRENVTHWNIIGATSDTPWQNSQALTLFINTNIVPLFLACVPPDYYLDSIYTRRLAPSGGQYSQVDYAAGDKIGLRGANAVSEQLCPCITLIPPMGVKSAGRIFMPAVEKADVNLNVFAAGYITAVDAFINACVAGGTVAGGTATLCIYSRKHRTSSSVAAHHLSPVIGYQRRRSHPIGS